MRSDIRIEKEKKRERKGKDLGALGTSRTTAMVTCLINSSNNYLHLSRHWDKNSGVSKSSSFLVAPPPLLNFTENPDSSMGQAA